MHFKKYKYEVSITNIAFFILQHISHSSDLYHQATSSTLIIMVKPITSYSALAFFLANVQSVPLSTTRSIETSALQGRVQDNWQSTLSKDTSHRLDLALHHLDDQSEKGQAFRNDTIMR